MKIDLYAYNYPAIKHNVPSFSAMSPKIIWDSENGRLIEKALEAMATVNAAENGINMPVAENAELISYDENGNIIKQPLEQGDMAGINTEIIFEEMKQELEAAYKNSKDPDIMNKHVKLYQDAYKNKDLLRGGYTDLSNNEIDETIIDTATVDALDILGKGTLEAAFALDSVGFNNFCVSVSDLKDILSKNNLELLKKKINPSNTTEYRNLEEEIKKDKKKINKLLGKENLLKRQELTEKIETLKEDKINFAQVKRIKKEIQNLYKNCENSQQIQETIQEIGEKQKKMKELLNQKVDLSPQEIINKVWTIASISQSSIYKTDELDWENHMDLAKRIVQKYSNADINTELDDEDYDEILQYAKINKRKLNKDIKNLIDLIKPLTPENEEEWKRNIDKKLYNLAGYIYNKDFADLLDLSSCKYLNELIISDEDFWRAMPILIDVLTTPVETNPPEYTLAVRLNYTEHNNNTGRIFENFGIKYNNWAYWDKNSFIEGKVIINAEDAKNKAVKNMCFDLAALYSDNDIPQKEKDKLFNALEQDLAVSFSKKGRFINVSINGNRPQYSDLVPIMSVIKKEMNNNPFWSEENPNEKIENRRDVMYNHLMLQRKQEIDNIKKLKESEVIDIKVRKVNMSDIKHSLCLGNHSHCCTALGSQSNEWSAPLYILSTCISAIEVLANEQPVGNTMMYMAHVNGKLALVLDDIELQSKYQNNDKIRDMIIKYAKQICKEVGKPDIPIYAGPGMHKVDISSYEMLENAQMVILGETPENGGVYLDFDGEQHDIGNVTEKLDLYKIA